MHAVARTWIVLCSTMSACGAQTLPSDDALATAEIVGLCRHICERSNQCAREQEPYECLPLADCESCATRNLDWLRRDGERARRCFDGPCAQIHSCMGW